MSSNAKRVVSLFEANVYSFDVLRVVPFFPTSKMTLHFIQLKLGNKIYKGQVSTEGCSYVDDFRAAIKTKLPHLLAAYDAAQLTLLQPDGNTEIDPGESITKMNEFNVGPWTPLVVTGMRYQQLLVAVLKNSSLTKE